MKKSLIGLLVIALTLCVAQSAQAIPSIWLSPSTATVGNNTVVIMELLVSDVTSSYGVDTWNFYLTYDTTKLDVVGCALPGDFLPYFDQFMDIGEGYAVFGPGLYDATGELSFTSWNSGTGGATGAGTVAIITFLTDATNSGTAYLDYTAWLIEPITANRMTTSDSTGDNIIITGGEGPVVPEPATMMLVAAGLAALGGYARKKRS